VSGLRQRLLDVFDVEYREHLEAMRQLLGKSAGEVSSGPDLSEATRRAHSLKGAARAVGLEGVEELAHRLESVFVSVANGESKLDRDVARFIVDTLDDIEDLVVAMRSATAGAAPQSGGEPPADPGPADHHSHAGEPATHEGIQRGAAGQGGSIRINAESLDRLLQSAGELHADMLLQTASAQEVRRISAEMGSLNSHWNALRKQMDSRDRHQPGPSGSGLLARNEAVTAQIKSLSRRLRTAAQQQGKAARSLHRHLDNLERRVKSARMIEAEAVFGAFRKMVRDLAASEAKQVEITVEGLECQADRLVLQRIKDPIMHMLRNAVSHGIEPPAERIERGKDARGRITLRVTTEHGRLRIVIEDDGRGIDLRRIADKAVERNRLSREDADAASRDALVQLLFEPGFSTAETVTTISGRGVGLSVAHEAVTGLQGALDIRAGEGNGTRIEMALPVSVLSRRLLLVSFRDQIFALPSEAVVRVMCVPAEDLITIEGRPAVRLSASALPLVSIGEVVGFGDPTVAARGSRVSIAVVRTGGVQTGVATHVGVAVESFVSVNDFIVRTLDLGATRLWSGVIRTEDGAPCLVLNTSAFVRNDTLVSEVFRTERRKEDQSRTVLVVDDSITTRTLEKSILEAHGYKVRLSVDGRDALVQLRSDPPDVVVSDIEMPHVDGFELVRAMKDDAKLSNIPVILVTSRSDNADRERGLKLGADAYVVKQKFDQNELLRTIRQVI
jgi:two-component system chemotaxis sensor kinase CheA